MIASLPLEQIINHHPLIVSSETPLAKVLELISQSWSNSCNLARNEENLVTSVPISYALVMSNSQILGILTERDIVQLIATSNNLIGINAADIMTRQVITLKTTEFQDIFTILRLFCRYKIRHLPILDENNQLLGIVTQENIYQALQSLDLLKFCQVREIIDNQPIYASPTASVLHLAQLMSKHQVNCIAIAQHLPNNESAENEKSSDLVSSPSQKQNLKPLGIITEREIVQLQLLDWNLERLQVQTLMSKPLFFASFKDSLWTINQQMQRHRIDQLLVVGLQGELLGIVTKTNLLRMLDPMEMYKRLERSQQKIQQLETETDKLSQYCTELLEQQEQNQQEKAILQQKEQLLQSILDNAQAVIYAKDSQGQYILINHRYESLFHINREEVKGRTDYDIFPSEIADVFRANDRQILQAGIPQEWEEIAPQEDGLHTYLSIKFPLQNSTGTPFAVCGISTDITERKQAEAALHESNLLLRTISSIQSQAIADVEPKVLFDGLLDSLLELTQSEYGFIGEVLFAVDGSPYMEEAYMKIRGRSYLKTHAITNIAWNEETRIFYEKNAPKGMEFHNLNTLFGAVIVTGKPVIANSPSTDNRRGGLPDGHPPLNAFLGLPFYSDSEMTGMVGIANRPDGYQESLVSYLQPLLSTCSRIIEAYRNNRQRQQAEKKISEQAALLDITTDAIIVQELNGKILFWNQGAEHLYGWQKEEVKRENANKLLYQESLSQEEEIHQILIEQGEWQGELHQITKTSQKIIVESRWTLVRDEQGKPKSALVVSTDITKKKQLESQLFHTQRLESLGTLAGGIAHDLNNILTPILMSAQILPMTFTEVNEKSQQLLKLLENNTKRGAALVKQILAFARGVEGEDRIIQIRHLLQEIRDFAQQTFPKSIEVKTNIPKDLWTVQGDATQLHQVLINLCVNARDAMPKGGILNISAQNLLIDENYARMNLEAKIGSYIVITVSDTGTGIPQNIIDRIFEPFFTTKGVGQGTGLGLFTVIGIVKSNGGFINVYSEVDQGSQFKVYFPTTEAAEIELVKYQNLPRGKGELILVVDDETLIRESTKVSLEAYNYRSILAADGIEAIALYAQHQHEISVILMDIIMPSMDGITAIRTLQKINPSVKLIVISGLASNDKLAQAQEIGFNDFLLKPYTIEDLLVTLNQVISA